MRANRHHRKSCLYSSATTIIWGHVKDQSASTDYLDERHWTDINFCRKFKVRVIYYAYLSCVFIFTFTVLNTFTVLFACIDDLQKDLIYLLELCIYMYYFCILTYCNKLPTLFVKILINATYCKPLFLIIF